MRYPPPHPPPPPPPHQRPMPIYRGQPLGSDGKAGSKGGGKPTPKKPQKAKSPKTPAKRPMSSSPVGGQGDPNAGQKKAKKSTPKKQGSKKQGSKGGASGTLNPVDRQKAAATIQAVNAASGGKNDRAAALAAAILRGVTMRPSGKWQAQLYYAGKSRYIGVFDTREKAALAYEIAREKLKSDSKSPADQNAQTLKATEDAVNSARKAAFEGVNEKDPRVSK